MPRSGHHRIHSFARRLATPILLASAGFVGYAVWQGEVSMLRISAVSAVVAGAAAVALFDLELIRNRRDHGAERAAQAKAYIELSTQRRREHLQVAAVPVPRLSEDKPRVEAAPPVLKPVKPAGETRPVLRPAPALAELAAPSAAVSTPDLWDDQDEAPTVVDLIAYEVRARLAEDKRPDVAEEPRAASG